MHERQPRLREFVAVVGRLDEVVLEAIEVVVESAAVRRPDLITQLREPDGAVVGRIVPFPQRNQDGQPRLVAQEFERFRRVPLVGEALEGGLGRTRDHTTGGTNGDIKPEDEAASDPVEPPDGTEPP